MREVLDRIGSSCADRNTRMLVEAELEGKDPEPIMHHSSIWNRNLSHNYSYSALTLENIMRETSEAICADLPPEVKVKTWYKTPNSNNGNYLPYFGECFEHWIGVVLALSKQELIHRMMIKTGDEIFETDYVLSGPTLLEVKSGRFPKPTYQSNKYLETGLPVMVILYDEDGTEYFTRKGFEVKTLQDLDQSPLLESRVSALMESKDVYSEYIKEHDAESLQVNIFSIYDSIKRGGASLNHLGVALEAAYRNDKLKKVAEEYGFRWLSRGEYNKRINPRRFPPMDVSG